jgi:undecaprenyl-diphosphatase
VQRATTIDEVRVNYHLFELINQRSGRADGVDDVIEFTATWLIYLVFAVAAVLVAAALRRGRIRPVLEIGAVLVLASAGRLWPAR